MPLPNLNRGFRTITWLRRTFPPPHPVRVRRLCMPKGEKLCGDTWLGVGMRFAIRVERRQSWALALDTLLHEWAHTLTWHGNDTDWHGAEWGLQYARIYRAFLEWNYGQ